MDEKKFVIELTCLLFSSVRRFGLPSPDLLALSSREIIEPTNSRITLQRRLEDFRKDAFLDIQKVDIKKKQSLLDKIVEIGLKEFN